MRCFPGWSGPYGAFPSVLISCPGLRVATGAPRDEARAVPWLVPWHTHFGWGTSAWTGAVVRVG